MITDPREAAFLAVYSSLKEERFAADFLLDWKRECSPSSLDFRFAQEIAFGTIRMALALDYLAKQLTTQGKIQLKLKERALLRTALYQASMMDRVPLFAIVNETVHLAKKHFSQHTANFINALLRRWEKSGVQLPPGDDNASLSIRFSYPLLLIEKFVKQFGKEKAIGILELGNKAPMAMVRLRKQDQVIEAEDIEALGKSSEVYLQNITPVMLAKHLAGGYPKRILDLCAAPGGKLLLAHDLYPRAALYANDVKVKLLEENAKKYGLKVALSQGKGEDYVSDLFFDLIILDVPCSNTGVLNKRPEARFRVAEENLKGLIEQSRRLIGKAVTLLAPGGKIWYMTCSILEEENQKLIEEACQKFSLIKEKEQLILPDESGADGGYGVALMKR